jgi:hypothetical protein
MRHELGICLFHRRILGSIPTSVGFHTIIEDEATPSGRPAGLATLDWATNGRDSDGRPILEVTVTAQLVLQGMALTRCTSSALSAVQQRC